jgi:SAM-dependent methyltransferase
MESVKPVETPVGANGDDQKQEALFDAYAAEYEAALGEGLSVSGEGKEYFAQARVNWLQQQLQTLKANPAAIMDFGCGTGTATPYLLGLSGAQKVTGVDVSSGSLKVARRENDPGRSQFLTLDEYTPSEEIDLAFCNGVFHHIPLDEREKSVNYVWRSLRPGALFALWENNPWNPGTRYVMSKIPFDKDAITLPPPETRKLLKDGGFEIVRTDFLFLFPKFLSFLRFLEPPLASLPMGAQYMVLGRKPK